MIAALLLCLGGVSPPAAEEVERYRSAAAAYGSGALEEAEAGFRGLVRSPTAIAPLARFARANSLVRQATRRALSAREKNDFLRAAVAEYRAAIDLSDPAAPLVIKTADARYNLELAKRLLVVEGNSLGPPAPNSAPTGVSGTIDRPTAPVDSPPDPQATPPGGTPTRADSGPTSKTSGGLAFGDVGKLEPAEAQTRLRSALSRIHRERPTIRSPLLLPLSKLRRNRD